MEIRNSINKCACIKQKNIFVFLKKKWYRVFMGTVKTTLKIKYGNPPASIDAAFPS